MRLLAGQNGIAKESKEKTTGEPVSKQPRFKPYLNAVDDALSYIEKVRGL